MILMNKTKLKILFFIAIFFLGIIILVLPLFINTGYYTNQDLAFNAVQGKNYLEGVIASKKYLNVAYWGYNTLCQIWGWLSALFIIGLFLKTDSTKFYKLSEINNKKFIYLWANISYIIWSILSVILYVNNLGKYVYDSCHDTLAIPLFESACHFIYFSAIYYPLVNIIIFFTHNKKIKNIWIIIVLLATIVYTIFDVYIHFIENFMWISILINILNIVWFALCINALKVHMQRYSRLLSV